MVQRTVGKHTQGRKFYTHRTPSDDEIEIYFDKVNVTFSGCLADGFTYQSPHIQELISELDSKSKENKENGREWHEMIYVRVYHALGHSISAMSVSDAGGGKVWVREGDDQEYLLTLSSNNGPFDPTRKNVLVAGGVLWPIGSINIDDVQEVLDSIERSNDTIVAAAMNAMSDRWVKDIESICAHLLTAAQSIAPNKK